MSAPIPCFFLEPTETVRLYLRRYVGSSKCPGRFGYHNAAILIGEAPVIYSEDHDPGTVLALRPERDEIRDDDVRWPKKCDYCDHHFDGGQQNQLTQHVVYRRADNGELMTLHEAPIGAMWYADWHWQKGPDGRCLAVKVPGSRPTGHDWIVDGRASNCTMPDDNVHRCWVRHGTPPNITVDKGGNTCKAGAGSIKTDTWHGFLRGGMLVT